MIAGQDRQLKAFAEILTELHALHPGFPRLPGQHFLELGPGRNLKLLKHVRAKGTMASIQGVGRAAKSWWRAAPKAEDLDLVHDSYILPFLKTIRTESIDIIVSRHVLEQHSLDARLLFRQREFRNAIRQNSFADLPESFPASPKNIISVFAECYRILKPGGCLITEVAKKKYAVLTEAGLSVFQPHFLRFRRIGKFSEISTFVK